MKNKRYPVALTDAELNQYRELSKDYYGKENLSGYMSLILRRNLNQESTTQKEAEPIKITTPKNNKTKSRSMQRTNIKSKPTLTPQQLQKMVDDMKQ